MPALPMNPVRGRPADAPNARRLPRFPRCPMSAPSSSPAFLLRTPNAIVFGASLVVLFAQLAWAAPQLPETVASHFDAAGRPDAWMSRGGFLTVLAVVHLLTAVSIGGVGLWLPRVGNMWINLPNKDYWLAPERRDATLADVARRLFDLGTLTSALLFWVVLVTVDFNRGLRDAVDGLLWPLGIYLVLTLAWIVALYRRFPAGPRDVTPR